MDILVGFHPENKPKGLVFVLFWNKEILLRFWTIISHKNMQTNNKYLW